MIGRDEVRARFRSLIDELPRTAPEQAFVIEGEVGVGKSALIDTVRADARRAGLRILEARGLESDLRTGFAGLHELLHPVLDQVEGLPPRQRAALLTAFGLASAPPPDRLLLSVSVLTVFEELTAEGPLVVLLEDAQWLDGSTAEIMAFLARLLKGTRVLFVVAVRDLPAGSALPAAPYLRVLREQASIIRLEPLDPAAAAQLLDALEPGLQPSARDRVLAESQGNPLALREFAVSARAGDAEPLIGTLATTRRLQMAFLSTLRDLTPSAQKLLLVLAADEHLTPGDLDRAMAALGLARADLDALHRADLVRSVDGQIRFQQPVLRSVVYGAAPSAATTEVQTTLAQVSEDPERATWHRAATVLGTDETVAAELETVAEQAAGRGNQTRAAHALHRSAMLTPDPQVRADRLVRAADHASQSGQAGRSGRSAMMDAAHAALRDADQLIIGPGTRARWMVVMERLELSSREPRLSVADFLSLARELESDQDQAGRLDLLSLAAHRVAHYTSTPYERRTLVHQLRSAAAVTPLGKAQLALALLDPLGSIDLKPYLPSLARDFADDPQSLLQLAMVADRLQDLGTAASAWAQAHEAFRRAGRGGDEALARTGMLAHRLLSGDPAEASAPGIPMIAALRGGLQARALVWRGDLPAAEKALESARSEGISAQALAPAAGIAWAAGLIALHEQRFTDALTHLGDVLSFELFAFWSVADLAEAAARVPATETVRDHHRHVEQVARAADLLGGPYLRSLAARARALLAGDEEAEPHFRTALTVGGEAGNPLELARTKLLFGEWLRRQRRPVDARRQLSAARETFEAKGAPTFAERATGELRAAGVDPEPAPGIALTPQELQIARLAAAGRSNKEIADQLNLSPRTVGAHLYKLFPKIGVTSRRQLPQALERAGVLPG